MSEMLTRRELAQRLGAGAMFLFTFRSARAESAIASRLHIGHDGTITVLTGKVEVGQGIRTTLTQVAAEELAVPISQVNLVMADTDLVPDDGGTWGSLTTPQTVPVIRQACASLRAMLRKSGAASYTEFAQTADLEHAVVADAPLIEPTAWRVCGTSVPNLNGPSIVTGGHRYSSDLCMTDMLHGRVLRGPNYHSKLLSVDVSKAAAMPGVRVVHDGTFLGVTAPTRGEAEAALRCIEAHWSAAPLGDEATLFQDIKANAKPAERSAGRYPTLLEHGSVTTGLASAPQRLKASYQIAYISHVPLEARTAVAQWQGDKLTVHCGTQAPFVLREDIAEFFKIAPQQVRIVVSDTGSGYGGKQSSDCELEAARLARGAGKPVRLAWSRAEEFTQSYCRPAALMEVESGFAADGKLLAWDFRNYNGGPASLTPPYQIADHYIAYQASSAPLRQGSYRSLAAVGNTFARETHMDEIAAETKQDPLELRLRNTDNARLKTVMMRAAERFGWGKQRSGNGVGYGMSCNFEKGGHLALFVEAHADGKNVRLRRMVAAFDAGAVVNPDILSNQVEGALIQGMGGALFERLSYDNERITNGHLATYRVPRFTDVPEVEVILVDRRDQPSTGAGESPITVAAPAIGSALFAATGTRHRSLPMLPA